MIDAEANQHIWADHFDRDLSNIFAVQDEITERVATTLQPAMSQAEQHRAMRKRPENMDAWDRYQKGMWLGWQLKLPAL